MLNILNFQMVDFPLWVKLYACFYFFFFLVFFMQRLVPWSDITQFSFASWFYKIFAKWKFPFKLLMGKYKERQSNLVTLLQSDKNLPLIHSLQAFSWISIYYLLTTILFYLLIPQFIPGRVFNGIQSWES